MEELEKKKIIDEANVLLISDDVNEYKELIDYGFKNIDHMKSIIRADKYFKKYPEQLRKYHVIIKGRQMAECFGDYPDLIDKLRSIGSCSSNLVTWLYDVNNVYSTYGLRCVGGNGLYAKFNNNAGHDYSSLFEVFDSIVQYISKEKLIDEVDSSGKCIYHDFINTNKLPLPVKKKDLKILCLCDNDCYENGKSLAEELGLDITFARDCNAALAENVVNQLGDYDIIVASKQFSSKLLYMNNESTEQCKDTGRLLTMLAYYDISLFPFLCNVSYGFGGEKATGLEREHKSFSLLETKKDRSHFSSYYAMRSLLEVVISQYNTTLTGIGVNDGIGDLDLRSADDFNAEYEAEQKRMKELRELELAPIKAFDKMSNIVKANLYDRRYAQGSRNELTISDLRITDLGDRVKLDNIYQGRVLCSIVIPKRNNQLDNFRWFELQTLTNKGDLSRPQKIGLYTSELIGEDNLPSKPNEKQMEILEALEKKVDTNLPCMQRQNDKGTPNGKKYVKQLKNNRY